MCSNINHNRIIYACISTITYLYGLFWLVMALIVSTNITDNGQLNINIPLLNKNIPTETVSYILLSFSLSNVANCVFGCMFMEMIFTSDMERKPVIYKRFVTVSNIYVITMGSMYLSWILILFQLLLYISTIHYIDTLVELEQTRVMITGTSNGLKHDTMPGIITAQPCKDTSIV